ncbi:MAG TPA: CHRD domain-containing protein [Acetobacteraceae bacterium]|nr:CHRD domain-containing protein [Acetobacteraceae bacterium]
MRLAFRIPLSAIAVFLAGTGAATAKTIPFHAVLVPAPHVRSHGSGTMTGTFDTKTHEISWKIRYGKLSGRVLDARVHGPAKPGRNAPVIMTMPAPYSSPILGVKVVTGKVSAEITGGYSYVVLATEKYPAGELRGRIRPGP